MVSPSCPKNLLGKHRHGPEDRIVRSVITSGLLFIGVMLVVASGAIAAGWLTNERSGQFDLQRWLILELTIGAIVSTACGYLCRRIANHFRGPTILALSVFCVGLLETSAILSFSERSKTELAVLLAILAPFVSALGVLIGGWRPQGQLLVRMHQVRELRIKSIIQYGLPALVVASAALLSIFALPEHAFANNSLVTASALTLDLVVTLPVAAYLLLIRTRRLPFITIFPIFALGYAIALATIPLEYSSIHEALKWVVIPVELSFFVYIVTLAGRTLKSTSKAEADFADRLRAVSHGVLNKRIPADILTTEFSILYYALCWRKSKHDQSSSFTVYRDVGYPTVLVVLLALFTVEIVALHLILVSRVPTLTWFATGLSVYGLIWIVGDFRAMMERPIRITGGYLRLRVGVRWEADIPLDQIASVESHAGVNDSEGKDAARLAMLGQSNMRLMLHEPIEIIGMYGLRKKSKDIRVQVDHAEELCRLVRNSCQLQ